MDKQADIKYEVGGILWEWKNKMGSEATLQKLIDSLRSNHEELTAGMHERQELFNHDT